jgi:hypothetical protein
LVAGSNPARGAKQNQIVKVKGQKQKSSDFSRFAVKPVNLREGVEFDDETQLDAYFFFHQPTSFFTIDSRIDRGLRELISESENCLKMNFLVGASACLRKAIYVLLEMEQAQKQQPNGRIDYRESIIALKGKFPRVPSEYFDALSGIQQMASDQVHEGSWKAWDSARLRVLLELAKNVLHEMYVVPREQEGRAAIATQMLSELKAGKTETGQRHPVAQSKSNAENAPSAQKPTTQKG